MRNNKKNLKKNDAENMPKFACLHNRGKNYAEIDTHRETNQKLM